MWAIYARVSTEDQARLGYSLADQVRRSREKIPLDEEVIEYIDDGYSGEFIDRPALDRLRIDLKNGLITKVIVYDLDRLSRETEHLLILVKEIERKAKLIFVTNEYAQTPAGELFMTLHAGIAKYEKAMIKERTTRGKRQKALSGKLTHNDKALGYDYDYSASMYTINEKEAETIREIFRLYTTRNYGLRKLAQELNQMGLTTKKGTPFIESTLLRMLKNEMYCGTKWTFRRQDKKVGQKKVKQSIRRIEDQIPVSVPAIIDRDLWLKAQQTLEKNKYTSIRKAKHDYLLKNIIKCGICGRAMIGQSYESYGRIYHYYACTGKIDGHICGNKLIRAADLDKEVWEYIYDTAKRNVDFSKLSPSQVKSDKVNYRKKLEELEKKLQKFLKWAKQGIGDIDQIDKDIEEIQREIVSVRGKLTTEEDNQGIHLDRAEILAAKSFEDRRRICLHMNVKIKASKEAKGEPVWSFAR